MKIKISALTNWKKPFIYKNKKYNRDELKKLGLDKEAHKAILKN